MKEAALQRIHAGVFHIIKNYPTDARKPFKEMFFPTSQFFMYLYDEHYMVNIYMVYLYGSQKKKNDFLNLENTYPKILNTLFLD